MANSTKIGDSKQVIEITGLDADWDWNANLAEQYRWAPINRIKFIPSAANDRMIIRDGGLGKATLFDTGTCSDTGARVEYFDRYGIAAKPFIDISECTLSSAADAKVIITLNSYR